MGRIIFGLLSIS